MPMDARERFERTRKAIPRFNEIKLLLMFDGDDWKPPAIKAHNEKSDPTANRAIYNVDERAEMLESLRKEEHELESLIGETLAIIHSVRDGLGDDYADVLDWRYIDGYSFGRIEDECGVSKATAHGRIEIALDWVDSVGVSKLLRGQTEL